MANYAVRLPRLSAAQWAGQVPLYSVFTRGFLEESPQAGFELWLRALSPSLTQRSGLERMMDRLWSSYLAGSALAGPEGPDWVEYLSRLDANWILASLPPALRSEEPSRYQRPLRWFAFT